MSISTYSENIRKCYQGNFFVQSHIKSFHMAIPNLLFTKYNYLYHNPVLLNFDCGFYKLDHHFISFVNVICVSWINVGLKGIAGKLWNLNSKQSQQYNSILTVFIWIVISTIFDFNVVKGQIHCEIMIEPYLEW